MRRCDASLHDGFLLRSHYCTAEWLRYRWQDSPNPSPQHKLDRVEKTAFAAHACSLPCICILSGGLEISRYHLETEGTFVLSIIRMFWRSSCIPYFMQRVHRNG